MDRQTVGDRAMLAWAPRAEGVRRDDRRALDVPRGHERIALADDLRVELRALFDVGLG